MQDLVRTNTWATQIGGMSRVITAMILRDIKTRFGRNRFGLVWVLLEPILFLAGFLMLRFFLETRVPFGQNMALFLLTGILVFRTFSSIATRAQASLTANRALLAYPPVKPFDIIAARICLETMVMFVVWVIFFGLLAAWSEQKVIVHFDRFFEATSALVLLSASMGVFNAVMAALSATWERIWPLIRLPLLFLSGIFYVPILMPPWVQAIIWWNPVLHCVEWLRTATYVTYDPLLDKSYVLIFSSVVLALGLLIERGYRHVILSNS
jgi:capsular polysaccharide transport system permease protein